jgi:hypothetical protein
MNPVVPEKQGRNYNEAGIRESRGAESRGVYHRIYADDKVI